MGANLSFTLHQHFVNQSEGIVSTFSGKDIGAKIKGDLVVFACTVDNVVQM